MSQAGNIGVTAPWEAQQFRHFGFFQQYGAFFVRFTFILDAANIYSFLYVSLQYLQMGWSQRYVTLALLCVFVFGLVMSLRHLYRSWRFQPLPYELAEVYFSCSVSFLIVVALLLFGTQWAGDPEHRQLFIIWFVLSLCGITASRAGLRLFLRLFPTNGHDHRQIAFFGATETARHLLSVFKKYEWMGITVVGVYDDRLGGERQLVMDRSEIAGNLDDLLRFAHNNDEISAIYITLPMEAEKRIRAIVDRFADTTVSIYYCPALHNFELMNARWDDIFGQPVISIVASPFHGHKQYIKRLEDLLLLALILPVALVPMLLVALAVKLSSPGPILYLQTRYGLDGRPFKIRKFRTMYRTDSDDEFVQAKKNDARITPLGIYLRKTSLDELPQLLNVLMGQMSIIGPRPAPIKYNEVHRRLIHRYMVRHKIKPGITGWAQVNGCRGETETLEKTEMRTKYDLEYINNWSIWLDLCILHKTVAVTLRDCLAR